MGQAQFSPCSSRAPPQLPLRLSEMGGPAPPSPLRRPRPEGGFFLVAWLFWKSWKRGGLGPGVPESSENKAGSSIVGWGTSPTPSRAGSQLSSNCLELHPQALAGGAGTNSTPICFFPLSSESGASIQEMRTYPILSKAPWYPIAYF